MLPTDSAARKAIPIARGVLDYFPDAIAAVAEVSRGANEQHNPGEPMHWSRDKSPDHADCIARHLIDRGRIDSDGVRHSAKIAWRALALLQIELEDAAANILLTRAAAARLEAHIAKIADRAPPVCPDLDEDPIWNTPPVAFDPFRGA